MNPEIKMTVEVEDVPIDMCERETGRWAALDPHREEMKFTGVEINGVPIYDFTDASGSFQIRRPPEARHIVETA